MMLETVSQTEGDQHRFQMTGAAKSMETQSIQPVPSRYRYMAGVLEGLRSLGGNADTRQIYDWLIDQRIAYPNDLTIIQRDGGTRFHKEVRWARKELFDAGLIVAPDRGVWALTSAGADTHLTPDAARMIVSARANERRRVKLRRQSFKDDETSEPPLDEPLSVKSRVLTGPTTGPIPATWTGEVTRTTSNPTWTYLMRFGERDVWKIGHTADIAARLADLNRHIPTEVLGEAWAAVASRAWPDALLAYQMEQNLLRELSAHRSIGERLGCNPDRILATWSAFSPP